MSIAPFKRIFLFIFLSVLFLQARAQNVDLISLDQMEKRFARGGDTTFVVNFWATWCAPCIAELPYFEKLQFSYRSEPLKVLLVSLDMRSKILSDVEPFVKKKGFQTEVFLLDESNQQEYIDKVSKEWSGAIPATLVIKKSVGFRKFYEKEFTYLELEKIYQLTK